MEPPDHSCTAYCCTHAVRNEGICTTLTVRLEPQLLQRFKLVAVKKERPMSEIIREFIEWYAAKEEA